MSLVVKFSLFVVCCLLFVGCLFVVCRVMRVVPCLLVVVRRCLLSFAIVLLLVVCCSLVWVVG